MTRSSLIYTRSAHPLLDAPIRAWDAGHMSHVGIRVADQVVDATLFTGVAKWPLEQWLQGRVVVADLPVYATTQGRQEQAEGNLFDRVGMRYDILEALGYPLLRDLGDPDRPVCSRLGYDFLRTALGCDLPGRQGRIGPRLLFGAHHFYNAGLMASIRAQAHFGEQAHG
jgi:hypothetical protein